MDTNHNRIKVSDLEKNEQNKILKTNSNGELEFSDINDISYNSLDYIVPGKALDARQGKILKDLIDDANELLATDNVDLNTLQKLGDAIEVVCSSLSTIVVNDLSSGGTTKALSAEMGKTLQNNKVDKISGKSLISDSEITRLASLSNYVHPPTHAPNIIAQDSENRFVSDAEKANWNAKQTSLGFTPENASNKNTANGYAGLGADGKLISSQLPAITVNDTFVVASETAMLALIAETGDIAVRTDLSKSFILKGSNSDILNDWQELLTPTSEVTKVFGRNGSVTAQAGDYNADQITETSSRKFQSATQQAFNDATSSIQTQLNSKASTTGSGASGTWTINVTGNANTAGGLAVHSSTNNEPNKIVRTDGNGYIQAGWINTISGDSGATPINRIYASDDQYLRYYTPANFINSLGLATTATNRWYDGWVNLDANTISGSKSGFTYANNAPFNGPLVHFDAGGYGLQLNSVYHVGNEISFRSRNGDGNTWNRWNRIWHDGNDSSLLKVSSNSSTPLNSNFAIGTESNRNFIQSHNGYPLDINPLGNTVTINGNTALHVGNFNPNNVVQGGNARGRSISKNNGNANNSDETNPSGFFYGNTVMGMPNNDWWNWINIAGSDWSGIDGYGFQIANSFWNGNLLSRNMTSGSWSGWRTIIDTENLINYAAKLNGSNASGVWPISVNGNSTGFPFQPGIQLDNLSGNTSTIAREETPSSGYSYTSTLHMGSGDGRQQLTISRDGSGMKFRGNTTTSGTSGWTSWKTVLTDSNYATFSAFSGAITGASLTVAGDVTAFSDARVKENIRPISNAIERIKASRGVVYDRIDNNQKDNIGFIAQELEENFPELVITHGDGTKAVKYQNAVAILFEAIKEQQAQIDYLLAKIDE
ncbi:MAG: tail fiber domain-containing protein [Flavobacterium sp.]|uniref:tail fiber domain-containing protein n=1 Tax=Flavobacterium sp. TaxID=239 RepID=UPI001B020353|nr:tail fiber domain-containing protein [Flavobacterium sp.]MBO9586634.1 tail fiber domain-containing protein [Flavobacterium sp.]